MSTELFEAPRVKTPQMVWLDAFEILKSRWKMKFAAGSFTGNFGAYSGACNNVELDVIVPTAKRIASHWDGQYPPSPPQFAKWARQLNDKHHRAISKTATPRDTVFPGFAGKRFWFVRVSEDSWRCLERHRYYANILPDGSGIVGITDLEYDRVMRGQQGIDWDWL